MPKREDFNSSSDSSPSASDLIRLLGKHSDREQANRKAREREVLIQNLAILFRLFFLQIPVSQDYAEYNRGLWQLHRETKDSYVIQCIWRNRLLLILAVFLPLLLSFSVSFARLHSHWGEVHFYAQYLSRPCTQTEIFSKLREHGRRVAYAWRYFPIHGHDLSPFASGYFISWIGAVFLRLHPALRAKKRISKYFRGMNYIDPTTKKVWDFVVLPGALFQVDAVGQSPETLFSDVKFYSIIEFKKSEKPKRSRQQANRYIIREGFDLDELGQEGSFEFSFTKYQAT